MAIDGAQVFVDEQGFTAEQEDDGLDTDCLHMLALSEDGMPLGTLRFFPPPKGKIGRLGKCKHGTVSRAFF